MFPWNTNESPQMNELGNAIDLEFGAKRREYSND